MPYSNSLIFSDPAEITFHPTADSILIKVNNTDLGSINKNFPVTVFVEITGKIKVIWMREISDALYRHNNNNDPLRTVIFNQTASHPDLAVTTCISGNTFKIIGWDNEVGSITCAGGNGYNTWFQITVENNFKGKIETVATPAGQKDRLVVRYGQNIINACPGDAACCSNLFCYVCC